MNKLALLVNICLLSACGRKDITYSAYVAPVMAQNLLVQAAPPQEDIRKTSSAQPSMQPSDGTQELSTPKTPIPAPVYKEPPPLDKAKPVEIRLFRSYGTGNMAHIKARVIKPDAKTAKEDESAIRSLFRNINGLIVDEIKGVRVRFDIGNLRFYASSDAEGMIDLNTDAFKGLKPALHHIKAYVAGGQKFTSKIYHSVMSIHDESESDLAVISDIDDTIKISEISNKLVAAQKLLTMNPYKAKAMPGTSLMYQILEQKDKKQDGDFFYLSGSPMNLSREIYTFLDVHHFPEGAVELKKWGFEKGDDNPLKQENYKGRKLKAIFETYPHKSFLLFGDSSEKDTEIYKEIAAEYPNRVRGIFINNVTQSDPGAPRFEGVHLTRNASEAAQILRDMKLLNDYDLAKISAAVLEAS